MAEAGAGTSVRHYLALGDSISIDLECGGPIPFDRLLVFPETATCVDCSA